MAEELHTEIRRAKQAWPDALQAVGDDPAKQPHSDSPISVDISAFGVGVKKLQEATCDGVVLLRAKMMDMRDVALPKYDQRRVTYPSRRITLSLCSFSPGALAAECRSSPSIFCLPRMYLLCSLLRRGLSNLRGTRLPRSSPHRVARTPFKACRVKSFIRRGLPDPQTGRARRRA